MERLNSLPDTVNRQQLLFGINQGGVVDEIRMEHARTIREMDLDGYAVGGLAVGESHEGDVSYSGCDSALPAWRTKPVYLMGVGTPANILEAVDRGWTSLTAYIHPGTDATAMCTPTRGKLNLFNQKYEAGFPSHRRRMRLSCLPFIQQGLYTPSAEGKRNAWNEIMYLA